MKQVLAYLIVLAINLHLFAELAVLVSFKINQDYIAEFLCINKDVPESNCNGCCHLKKELAEQHENQDRVPQAEHKKTDIQFFGNETDKAISLYETHKFTSFFYLNSAGILFPNNIFHPPKQQHA